MEILLRGIAIVLAGGIALLNLAPSPWCVLGIALIVIALLAYMFIVIWRLWFSTRGWKFRTSNDKTKWLPYFDHNSKQPTLWESEIQKVGMFYEIDLGRVRNITKARFSDGQVCKLPLKSCFILHRDDADIRIEKKNEYPESSDEVELKPAFRARYINMRIVDPELGENQTWRVKAVYVTVKTLIGLKYTIGKCCLDEL